MTDTCYTVSIGGEFGTIRLRLGVKECEDSPWQWLTVLKASGADPRSN